MRYANNITGIIKIHESLPNEWFDNRGELINSFKDASVPMQEENGFFELVTPVYNKDTERLGEIYKDDKSNCYTYKVDKISVKDLEAKEIETKKAERNQKLEEGVVVRNIWLNKALLVEFLLKVQMYQQEGAKTIEWGLEGENGKTVWSTITIEEAYLAIKEAEAYFTSLYKDYA